MSEKEIKQLSSEIQEFLTSNKEVENIPESSSIINLAEKLSEKVDNAVSKDGVLRIGIVGQVKAGKSSFINALLFDGKDVLPKASTPMTAALTIVKYGTIPSAEVEFYSKSDWNVIERNAKEFEKAFLKIAQTRQSEIDEENKKKFLKQKDILVKGAKLQDLIPKHKDIFDLAKHQVGEAIFGSYELVQMAQNLDLDKYIGTTQTLDTEISDISNLVGQLNDYVGANGKFTPITRNTVLKLPIESLKDIELIDTPGINDPIVSRGLATRDFLSKCDTVFLLSTSSQFMGQEDSEFLVNTLPAEGVTNIILLGSKFDSVLVDEFKKYNGNIRLALKDIYKKLSSQASNSLEKVIASNPNKPIMKKLANRQVKFISSICYNIAKKGRANLDSMEKHSLEQIEKRYELKLGNSTLFDLANIDSIRDKDLVEIKNDKDTILGNKLNDLISGQSGEFKKELKTLEDALRIKIAELDKADISELENRASKINFNLMKIPTEVKQVFIDLSFDVEENIIGLIAKIEDNRRNYLNIEQQSKSKEESRRVKTGTRSTSSWYNPFSWGDEEDVYGTEYYTVNYNVANVVDAAENASKFVQLINSEINDVWEQLVDIKSAEKELIKVALNGFDLEDESFNKASIINPVKNALRAIKIDKYRVKEKKYIRDITESFSSSEVQGSQINQLKIKVGEVLETIVEDIEHTLEEKQKEIGLVLSEKGDNFTNSIKEHSEKEINKLLKDLENVQLSKERYNYAISEVQKFYSFLK